MLPEEEQKYFKAIVEYGNERYREGARAVLVELETFAGWLTMTPDTKRQQIQREWCLKRIEKIKEEFNINNAQKEIRYYQEKGSEAETIIIIED